VRTLFEDAHRSRKCASWKTPEIPSKVRTLFQDAHQKLSAFENEMEVNDAAADAQATSLDP
jgi:hypothetical protein